MTISRQISNIKDDRRLKTVVISTLIIIALLGAYAFFDRPGILKPRKVTIAGMVTAPGGNLTGVTFTNTGCGTRNEGNLSLMGESSATYSITLDNGYSYNVTIAWKNPEGKDIESEIGKLVLNTFAQSLAQDWAVQP